MTAPLGSPRPLGSTASTSPGPSSRGWPLSLDTPQEFSECGTPIQPTGSLCRVSSTLEPRASFWACQLAGYLPRRAATGFPTFAWAGTCASGGTPCSAGCWSESRDRYGRISPSDPWRPRTVATEPLPRRPPGTGSLFLRSDSTGRETWYGKWRTGQRQVKRRLGARRTAGSTVGLTRRQAEAALQEAMARASWLPATHERLSLNDASQRYLDHVEHVRLLKPSTLQDYALIVRRHLVPVFGQLALERITPVLISDYVATKLGAGLSPQTVTNQLNLFHSIFSHAIKRGWASGPVGREGVAQPATSQP